MISNHIANIDQILRYQLKKKNLFVEKLTTYIEKLLKNVCDACNNVDILEEAALWLVTYFM